MTFAALFAGIAVALALEGLLYATFPGLLQQAARHLTAMDPAQIRTYGVVLASVCVGVAWLLVRG